MAKAIAECTVHHQRPDLIISDYTLACGDNGIETIRTLRAAFQSAIPGLVITGNLATACRQEAGENDLPLLYKPVEPMALRSMVNYLLKVSRQLTKCEEV